MTDPAKVAAYLRRSLITALGLTVVATAAAAAPVLLVVVGGWLLWLTVYRHPLDASDLRAFRLTVERSAIYHRQARFRLDARRVGIDPAFLAHAIRYYREHPRARADIGTAHGHATLVSALRDG